MAKNEQGEYTEVDEKKALLKAQQALREGMQIRAKASPEVKTKKSPKLPTAAAPAAAAESKPPASKLHEPIAPRPSSSAAAAAPAASSKPPARPKVTGDYAKIGGLNVDDVLCGEYRTFRLFCSFAFTASSLGSLAFATHAPK